MNQAETQFKFNLQLFAEGDSPAEPSADTPSQEQIQPEPFDSSKLREMPQDDQIGYLSKHGFLGDEPTKEKKDEPKGEEDQPPVQAGDSQTDGQKSTEPEEQTFEILHNGQRVKVKQSELINLAQQGFDYTAKTQQLAEQRRQYEALIAAAQVQQQTHPPKQETKQPENSIQAEYQAAVSKAEKRLGIQPGEFNQFDPQHNFALQQVMMMGAVQQSQTQSQRAMIAQEVRSFLAEEEKDPATMREVNEHFEQYILKRGMQSPAEGERAKSIAYSLQRFLGGQALPNDLAVLKEHWGYVKGELAKEKHPAAPKPVVQPPKTETPGASNTKENPKVLDRAQLRALSSNPDQQIAYLKGLGVFN